MHRKKTELMSELKAVRTATSATSSTSAQPNGKHELDILMAAAAAASELPDKRSTAEAAAKKALEQGLDEMKEAISALVHECKSSTPASDDSVDSSPNQLDATAYLEALSKAPHLVQSESDPKLFLRFCNGDATAASRRLLSYWQYRREVFGPERAFLPLSLGGALTAEDEAVLHSGFLSLLKPDRKGRTVLCANRARRPKDAASPYQSLAKGRVIFYVLSLAAQNPLSQTQGLVVLSILSQKASLNVPFKTTFRDLVLHALPLKIYSLHVACCPQPGARRVFEEHFIPSALDAVGGRAVVKVVEKHIAKTHEELVTKLQVHGLDRTSVQKCLSGDWYDHEWKEQLKHSKGPRMGGGLTAAGTASPTLWAAAAHTTQASTERKRHGKRKAGAISAASMVQHLPAAVMHATAAPELTTHAIKALQEISLPPEALESGVFSADTIRKLNAVMSSIPAEIFAKGDNDEDRADFVRKRNALYSKRKYYKKKLQVESLTISRDGLMSKNLSLKKEQHRLEEMIREAQRLALEEETRKKEGNASSSAAAAGTLSSLASAAVLERQGLMQGATPAQLAPARAADAGLVDRMMLARNQQIQTALLVASMTGGAPAAGGFSPNTFTADELRLLQSSMLNTAGGAQQQLPLGLSPAMVQDRLRNQALLRQLAAARQQEENVHGLPTEVLARELEARARGGDAPLGSNNPDALLNHLLQQQQQGRDRNNRSGD